MKLKKSYLFAYLFIIACAFFVFVIFFKIRDQNTSMEKNAEYTKAVILKIGPGTNNRWFVDYRYVINGKVYEASVGYRRRKQTFTGFSIQKGDTCIIAYDRTRPEISTIYKDFTR